MSKNLVAVALGRRGLVIGAIIVVVLLVAATTYEIFVHRASANQVADLQVITGGAQVMRSGSTAFTTATTGSQLGSGDSVRTNADSLAAIHYPDGSLTRLAGSSTVQVKTLAKTSAGGFDVSFDQTAGKTWNEVKQLVNGSHFSVTAPNSSTAEVRGTTFSIVVSIVNGLTVVTVDVWNGSLSVKKGANGTPVIVNTGQQAIITSTSSNPTVQNIPESDKQDPFTIYNKTADTTQGKTATIIGPGTIKPGETTPLTQGTTADGNTDLDFGLGWGGSSLELCVFGPDSTLYECLTADAPPLHITIPDAEAGTWGFTLRAVVLANPEFWYLIVGETNPTKIPVVPFISAPSGQGVGGKGNGCERDVKAGETDTWSVKARSGPGKPTVTVDGITVEDAWTKTKYGTFKNDKGDVTIKFAPLFGVDPATTMVAITAKAKNGETVTLKCTENILSPATSTISGTVKGVGEGVLLTLDDAYSHTNTTTTDQYGVYSFTPIRGGTYKLTMTVPSVCTLPFDAPPTTATPNVDGTNTATVDFALNCPGGSAIAPRVSNAPLPDGTFGGRYSYRLTAFGGGLPQVWTKASGLLPPGLVFESTGAIHGTPDSSANSVDPTYSFTVFATGFNGLIGAPRTLSITIHAQPQIVFSPASGPPPPASASGFVLLPYWGERTVPYSQSFSVVGGIAPYTWSVSSGDPSAWGLVLSASGTLSGTPTASVQGGTIAVRVTDATGAIADGQVDINIYYSPTYKHTNTSRFDSTGHAEIDAGAYFRSYLGFTDGEIDIYTYSKGVLSVSIGAIPSCQKLYSGEGFSLSGNLNATCVGPFTFTLRLTDAYGGYTDSIPLTLVVNPALSTTPAAPIGTVGSPIVPWNITGAGGHPGTTYKLTVTNPPVGLSVAAGTNGTAAPTVQGTPTGPPGDFSVSVYVTDVFLNQSETVNVPIHINGTLLITTTTLSASRADINEAYTGQSLNAAGGQPPYAWTLLASPPPPGGLALSSAGVLSGPITDLAGAYSVAVQVCDSVAVCKTNTLTPYSMTVYAAPTITTIPSNPALWTHADTALSYPPNTLRVLGSGGYPDSCPYVIAVGLPAGMSMSQSTSLCPSNWYLTGQAKIAGTYNVTFTGTDQLGVVSPPVTGQLVVDAATSPIITGPASAPIGAVGLAYSPYAYSASASLGTQFDAATHSGANYDWSVSPALPTGMSLQAIGMSLQASDTQVNLIGTPTASIPLTTYTLTVKDNRTIPATNSITFTLQIEPSAPNIGAAPPGGDVGFAYSFTLTSGGGAAPFAFSLVNPYYCNPPSACIPGGLALAGNGTLSGTPTTAGTYRFGINVTDSLGVTNIVSVVLAISNSTLTVTGPASAPHTGVAYGDGFTVTGGTNPYIWALVSGTLPTGLTFDTFGHITGTPTGATGTSSTFSVKVTDLAGASSTSTATLTIS